MRTQPRTVRYAKGRINSVQLHYYLDVRLLWPPAPPAPPHPSFAYRLNAAAKAADVVACEAQR